MAKFSEVLEAASDLSTDEQESLLDILHRRLIERKRLQLAREIEEARVEFAAGQLRPASADEIMNEVCGES
jgi:hypothetical protein